MNKRLAVLALVLTGCPGPGTGGTGGGGGGSGGGSGGSGTGGGAGNATLTSITVTSASLTLGIGAMPAFTATGHFSDSTTSDLTAQVTWSSTVPAVASVSTAGVVTALTEGSTDVTATKGTVNGHATLTVSGMALISIAVTPATPNLGVGATQGFVANGTYFDQSTRNITADVTWSSSTSAVAGITAAGRATALTMGMTTITAALSGVTGTTVLTVGPKKLVSIAVTPRFVSLIEATTRQLTATGTYTDGTMADITSTVTWETSDTQLATVSTTGLVTGVVAVRGVPIYARSGPLVGQSTFAITTAARALQSITLTPQTMWVGETFPAPQVAADFGGIGGNYTLVGWTSSNPAVATIDFDLGMKGLSVGSTTLTATVATNTGVLTASNTLSVTEPPLQSLTVSAGAATATLAMGATLQLTATGLFGSSNLNHDLTSSVSWSSNNMAAVTVDSAGLARGVGAGSATITATSGAVMGTTMITVPSTAPQMMTAMLSPTDDNSIGYSSLVPATSSTVFATVAYVGGPAVSIGCAWYWSPPIGFAPEHTDASCWQGLIKFDLSSLANKTIVSARLRLTTKIYGVGYVPRQWHLYALASSWSGASITWDGTYGFLHYVYSQTQHDPPIYPGQIYDLDQTQTVRNWASGAYLNNGWELGLDSMLLPAVSNTSLDVFELHSKEDPQGRGPKLVVTYY